MPLVEEEVSPRNDGHEVPRCVADDTRALIGHATKVDLPMALVVYIQEVRVCLDVACGCLEKAWRVQGKLFWHIRKGLREVRDKMADRALVWQGVA